MVALFPGTVETYFTPRTKRIEFTMEKAARDLITLEAENIGSKYSQRGPGFRNRHVNTCAKCLLYHELTI